jgi:putative chitinase
MGNGNEASGDGYRYRGRCGLQATGKEMYSKVSAILDFDFVTRPDDLASPMWVIPGSLAIAKILKLGDVHGMEQDTRRLNGGTTNLANRKALFAKVQKLLP